MAIVVDAILILLMLVTVIVFCKRGAVKSIYGLIATVIACLAAYFLGPVLGNSAIKPMLGGAEDAVYEALMPLVESAEGAFDGGAFLDSLPEEVQSLMARCGTDAESLKEAFANLIDGSEAEIRSLSRTIAGPVTEYAAKALGCVAVFLLVTIGMALLKVILLPLVKLPILKQADGILGAVLGAVCAFAYAWVLCLAVSAVVEYGFLGEYNNTVSSLAEKSVLFRFFCDLSPMDLVNIVSVFK